MIADDLGAGPPATRRRLWPRLILLLLAFLGGVALTAWAVRETRLGQWVSPAPVAEPTNMLTAAPAPTPAPSVPAIAPAADPVAVQTAEALDQRVASLETRVDQVGRRAQLAAGDAARAEGLLVAFAARRALDRGLGLGYLEGQLRERFGASQPRAVATIITAAREPVTVEDLQLHLEELAPRLSTGGGDESWLAGVRRTLSELVVVRRVGTPSPLSRERLRRARRLLEGDRVDAAMAEVARMPGRAAAESWLADARRYVAARRALDVIETAALVADGLQPRADEAPATQPQSIP